MTHAGPGRRWLARPFTRLVPVALVGAATALGAVAGATGRPRWLAVAPDGPRGAVAVVLVRPSMPQFTKELADKFIADQALLIRSRRVAELAALDPAWRERGDAPPALDVLSERLTVEVAPSSTIRIGYRDADPPRALAATTAVLNAYIDLFRQQRDDEARLWAVPLRQERTRLEAALHDAARAADEDAARHGSTQDIDALDTAARARLIRLLTEFEQEQLSNESTTSASSRPAAPDPAVVARRARLVARIEEGKQNLATVSAERARRTDLVWRRDELAAKLDQVDRRLRTFEHERHSAYDLIVLSPATLDATVPADPRALVGRAASYAAMAGGAVAASLLALRSIARRVRRPGR